MTEEVDKMIKYLNMVPTSTPDEVSYVISNTDKEDLAKLSEVNVRVQIRKNRITVSHENVTHLIRFKSQFKNVIDYIYRKEQNAKSQN